MRAKLKIILLLSLYIGAERPLLAQEKTVTNSIGMEFVLIKPGSMVVGRYQPTVAEYVPPKPGPNGEVRKVLPPSAYKGWTKIR